MSNISSLVNVDWFLGRFSIDDSIRNTTGADTYSKGVPFDNTTNWRLDVVQRGQQILGDRILGFQAGNEPDLYFSHGRRNEAS